MEQKVVVIHPGYSQFDKEIEMFQLLTDRLNKVIRSAGQAHYFIS